MAFTTIIKPRSSRAMASAAATLLCLGLTAAPSHADTYRFEQDGYSYGAKLVIELEAPGNLMSERTWFDVTKVTVSFSGSDEVPALSFSTTNLNGSAFIFDGLKDGPILGDASSEGVYLSLPEIEHFAVFGFRMPDQDALRTMLAYQPMRPDGIRVAMQDESLAPLRLMSVVPESGTSPMMAMGLLALGFLTRRRSG